MNEEWRPVPGWEGLYEVSDQGHVRSLDHHGRRQFHKGRRLKSRLVGQGGYPAVGLHRDGHVERWYVHHLVLAAFVGPRPNKYHTRHLNGNSQDNRLINLRYGTAVENAADKLLHGTARTRPFVATHCAQGHEFNAQNTVRGKDGQRRCLTCRRKWDREAKRRYRQQKRNAA